MLRIILILMTLSLSVFLSGPIFAQGIAPDSSFDNTGCRIRIITAPNSWIIEGFDPFANGVAEGSYSATFVNDGDAECRFTPIFELQQPPFGLSQNNGRTIPYAILNMTDPQDVTPRSGRSQSLSITQQMTLQPNEQRSILYKLIADRETLIVSGIFSQQVALIARSDDLRSLGGITILIGVNVLPSARIGLAGAYTLNDGQAVVNLGALKTGVAPVPLQLRVNSTGEYDITLTSANNGRLRQGASQWSVPYSMIVNGTNINLSGTVSVSGPSKFGARNDSLPIQFVIGDISQQQAGQYSDTISISITAR